MKKTLLSVIAGLAVINAASAVPSPADRKALCEKHPEKYVWVEKDQFCVPINPCEGANDAVRIAYCFDKVVLPSNKEKRNMIMDRYIHEVMGTVASDVKEISDRVVGIKTNDGGYIAFLQGSKSDQSNCLLNLMYSVSAYGHLPSDLYQETDNYILLGYGDLNDISSTEMTDIADFASLLQNDVITYDRNGVAESGIQGALFICPNK